jgi:hypothetical protein
VLDGLCKGNVPELPHGILVGIALEPAAHGGKRRGRTYANLASKFSIPKVAKARFTVFGRCILDTENDRLGAPHARHDHAVAIDGGALTGTAVGKTWNVAVHGQLAGVPAPNKAISRPAGDTIKRRLSHIESTCLQRQLRLREHRVLVRQLAKVHLNSCSLLESREYLGSQIGIA